MRREIYLIGNAVFDDVISMPLLRIEFIIPDIKDWEKALGVSIKYFDIHVLNAALNDVVLIVSSKNAINALQQLGITLENKKGFVIGKITRHDFVKAGGVVLGMPDAAYGDYFIQLLSKQHLNKRLLYCRARESFVDIATQLQQQGIDAGEIVLYRSVRNPQNFMPPSENAIIIFGAPSSYHAFIARFGWEVGWQAIAIGKSTFNVFSDTTKTNASIAPQPTFQSCVKYAKEMRC